MPKIKNDDSLVRHFSPAWFAASMGTGGLANLIYQLSNNLEFLKIIAYILWGLNAIMFISFLIPWILRWFLHIDRLMEDMRHPVMSNFFVTMPVAAIILATNFLTMGGSFLSTDFIYDLSLILWIFGITTTLILSIYVTYNMVASDGITPEVANFSWFITPVASVVVPMLGNPLVGHYMMFNPELAKFINLMDLSFFGIGMLLFLILSAIVLNRFIFHKLPHIMMLPTFWIILGPIGVGTISLFGLASVNASIGYLLSPNTFQVLGVILWGFGFWAFGIVIFITAKYLFSGKLPFTLSWWAFIFPLVAYTLSSLLVYHYTNSTFIYIYTIFLTLVLISLWLLTLIQTIIGIYTKKLLLPAKPIKQE